MMLEASRGPRVSLDEGASLPLNEAPGHKWAENDQEVVPVTKHVQ